MGGAHVNCPTCGRGLEWSEQFPFRPFCSERCRLVDLGAWFAEERRVPGEELDELQGGVQPPANLN